MTQYIITWNVGYGTEAEVVDVKDEDAAVEEAYQQWKEASEFHSDYGVKEFTLEEAEQWDLQEQHPDYVPEGDQS